MQYLGNSAQVPLGDGTWSKFMPIAEAERFEHTLKVQRFLKILGAGKQMIGLSNDIPAMCDAQDLYKEERESATNTLTQANYRETTAGGGVSERGVSSRTNPKAGGNDAE